MLELKQGMKLKMSGPLGGGAGYLQNNSPSLLIAGGIGITPFRSIITQLKTEEIGQNNLHLLYLDSNKAFIFKDELDGIAENTSISVTYLDSRDELHQEIDKFTNVYKNGSKYYIAGPKPMVDTISISLTNNNISKQNIKKDAFFGN